MKQKTWIVAVILSLGLTPAALAQQDAGKAEDKPKPEAATVEEAATKRNVQEESSISFADALSGGDAAVDLRYRYEFVDEAVFANNGKASTLRTALSYGTQRYRGFRVFLQAENVTDVGWGDDHNNKGFGDSGNGVTDYPVIADPPGTEMLQAYVGYAGGETGVRLGRQVINYDDQRHVGAVGWRQHWQSHDAITATNRSIDNFTAKYAYLNRAHRIFRDKIDTSSHLINASYDFEGLFAITGYAYLLRYDQLEFAGLSRNTVGAEVKGSRPTGDLRLHYEFEYATQTDAGDNPVRINADYLHVEGGLGYRGFTLRVGVERIGGSPEDGQFQFVLGTNHAFNGWVDKFLSTPTNGLADFHVKLDGPLGPVRWQLRYHDFGATTGNSRYGSEFDFQVTYRTAWSQLFGLKGGVYSADEFSSDTTKIWVWTQYSF
ncbi:MAG: hypothetical protein GKS06_01120 [Acidobacteria bacterium]|nr:hypothetical protein [Acidobacteriota bacterium]